MMIEEIKKIPLFSLGRVWTIAASTVTQLIRMRVLYFLLAFAAMLAALRLLSPPGTPVKSLIVIKQISFGAMDTFAWLFAIISTALLIPQDIEDRTLYTILSKPVRRIEYLAGKLGGVLMVIGAFLAIMFLVSGSLLSLKETQLIESERAGMVHDGRYSEAEIEQQISLISKHGMQPVLAIAVLASFMKAAVIASVTILLSTFASSSLFTIIISLLVFLIGHFHTMATSFWLQESGSNSLVRFIIRIVKFLFPDFQLYSFSEGIVIAEPFAASLVWQMSYITVAYVVVFLALSLLVFFDKEF